MRRFLVVLVLLAFADLGFCRSWKILMQDAYMIEQRLGEIRSELELYGGRAEMVFGISMGKNDYEFYVGQVLKEVDLVVEYWTLVECLRVVQWFASVLRLVEGIVYLDRSEKDMWFGRTENSRSLLVSATQELDKSASIALAVLKNARENKRLSSKSRKLIDDVCKHVREIGYF